ncbi:MAG: aminotransferase class V-fold PLP-dependent enzyme, partial [Pseudomonadales bacterium]|nr:aminotransferase class V-fold PLP-dependent enzyme [Pseudomonadales bacterium]
YLDYAATTPVDPRVAAAMSECLTRDGVFGNPASTTHGFGFAAARRVEQAREQVARLIGAQPAEVYFTSGATEANNLAILGVARANADRGRHIVTARTEHRSVLDPAGQLAREGFRVTYLAPDRNGLISPLALRAALRSDTQLVSIMHANNETGVVQDLAALAEECTRAAVPLHTDAAQSAGKIEFDVARTPVAFAALSGHKVYGPKGIGALYIREAMRPRAAPIVFGGGHERQLRSGTLPTHQIVGFGAAAELVARDRPAEELRCRALRDDLWRALEPIGSVHLNGQQSPRLPHLLNVSFEGVEGESLVTGLTEIAVSTGSACSSAGREASYVLRSLGHSTQLAQGSLRISIGRYSTAQDVELAARVIRREVERLRAIAP